MIPALLMLAAATAWQGPSSLPIPAPASGVGYTTLAFHSDFTAPVFGQPSNWLDCAGAIVPQWFIAGFDQSSTPPCERVSIINDGGTQVLRMRRDLGDDAARALTLTTVNLRTGLDRGTDFPNGAYYQATFRVAAQAVNGNANNSSSVAWWAWSDTGAAGLSPSWMELDFFEFASNGGAPPLGYGTDDSCMQTWGDHGHGAVCISGWGDYYPVDQTAYHTFGALVTQNAGSAQISMCTYIDGVLQTHPDGAPKCGTITVTESELNNRNYPVLQAGLTSQITVPIDVLVKDAQIWTCGNWRGPLITPGHAC